MRILSVVVLAVLVCVASAEAAISRVGSCAAQATSCTFSVAPAAGDAIIVFAHRDGSVTHPTSPAGYQQIQKAGANLNSARMCLRISDGTETTTGVWTNATSITAVIYRGANVAPLGRSAVGEASSASIAYNTFTLNVTSGSSWVIGFAGHRTATNVGQAPTNMTLVASATDIAVSDTNAGVTAWTTQSVGVDANSGWTSYAIELLAQTGEDTLKLYVDDYLNANVGDANGTILTPTILANSTQGPDTTYSCSPATPTGFTIDAHVINAPATIRKRSPATDYAVGSTTRSFNLLHTSASTTTCSMTGLYGARKRGAASLGGYVYFAPPDAGAGSVLFDYWVVYNGDGNYCVMQLDNGRGGAGYGVNIESNPGGVTVHSAYITLTPATRYWVALYCNFQAGTASLAIYTTAGVQVGSTVTGSLAYTAGDNANGAYIDSIKMGQNQTGTSAGVTSIFQHTLVDYSAAKFPLGPNVTGSGCAPRFSLLGVSSCAPEPQWVLKR